MAGLDPEGGEPGGQVGDGQGLLVEELGAGDEVALISPYSWSWRTYSSDSPLAAVSSSIERLAPLPADSRASPVTTGAGAGDDVRSDVAVGSDCPPARDRVDERGVAPVEADAAAGPPPDPLPAPWPATLSAAWAAG